MLTHPGRVQNPVVLARMALTKLAEAALPPTPENFAREYRSAAGLPAAAAEELQSQALASVSAKMLLDIFEKVKQTTNWVSLGIERFDGDLKNMFGEFDQPGIEGVRGLIEGLTASKLALQKTLEASRLELDATRTRLDQVSSELERSRAQARIDPLTGFANRRGMEEFLEREIARTRRSKIPFSLAILDLDHFKHINDEYGHEVGDRALLHFAALAKSMLRETDFVCRYGGEEFVLILPGSGSQCGLQTVDRMREIVERTPLVIDRGKIQICFSAGVAESCGDEEKNTLLKRADQALYAAKRAGRNCVVVAGASAA